MFASTGVTAVSAITFVASVCTPKTLIGVSLSASVAISVNASAPSSAPLVLTTVFFNCSVGSTEVFVISQTAGLRAPR